ncbi:MAG: hypothetical protein QOK45_2758, partial [Mycobacterium sp.]|nr:hypothetical protein [Mycobacterium sp.]
MNGSPSRTRNSFEFLVRDRLCLFFAEPSVDEIPGDAGESVTARSAHGGGLRWGTLRLGLRLRGRPAYRRAADLTPMGHLVGPALAVPPTVLIAAFGVGLP